MEPGPAPSSSKGGGGDDDLKGKETSSISLTNPTISTSTGSTGATGATSATPPQRTPSSSSMQKASSHRQSFAENLRNVPPSPRSHRHPSFTQQAIQDLLNHPPASNKHTDPRFAGRDWRDISVGELVTQDEVKWVTMDTSVEQATMVFML